MRKAADERERVEREEAERVANESWFTNYEAEQAIKREEREAEIAAREAQDADFCALEISIGFWTSGLEGECFEDFDPNLCEFSEDPVENSAITANVIHRAMAALAPFVSHYESLGLVPMSSVGGGPRFCLVYRPDAGALSPESLAQIPKVIVHLEGQPGATLEVSIWSSPLNATVAFNESGANDVDVGRWGGPVASGLNRQAEETRDDWLARVATPTRTIERATERWRRSGGNLTLYGLCGSRGERAVGDKPIEYLIPGVLPRGYVSLLLGDQLVGKTTLLGEIAAVIDSQCKTERFVLGIPIEERGVSCFVSGEDGDDIINRRNDSYSAVHGQYTSFVIDLRTKPWPAALELLWGLPHLDFLALDPLRLLLEGDEDSSEKVSRFFGQLEALTAAKNCATLLAHHTGKKAPKGLSGMLLASRGSGVITQRPRAALGMLKRGANLTEIGLIKWNPPAEDAWAPVDVGMLFRKEQNTLVPVAAHAARSEDGGPAGEVLELIYTAVVDENSFGNVLRRTGKAELFERRLPRLAALSRNVIRGGVSTLLAAGRLIDGPEGLMAVGTAPLRFGA